MSDKKKKEKTLKKEKITISKINAHRFVWLIQSICYLYIYTVRQKKQKQTSEQTDVLNQMKWLTVDLRFKFESSLLFRKARKVSKK